VAWSGLRWRLRCLNLAGGFAGKGVPEDKVRCRCTGLPLLGRAVHMHPFPVQVTH
jgi:hypothetical protein